eukprot:1154873-Pelagomonas_calceolata.AAC.5
MQCPIKGQEVQVHMRCVDGDGWLLKTPPDVEGSCPYSREVGPREDVPSRSEMVKQRQQPQQCFEHATNQLLAPRFFSACPPEGWCEQRAQANGTPIQAHTAGSPCGTLFSGCQEDGANESRYEVRVRGDCCSQHLRSFTPTNQLVPSHISGGYMEGDRLVQDDVSISRVGANGVCQEFLLQANSMHVP